MESRRDLKTAAIFSAALLLVQALSAPLFAHASDMDYLTHDPRYQGCTMVDCIDVSAYQGDIDWNAVAADGIGEVILRLGFRGWGDTADLCTDDRFAENLMGATNAGLDVGVYFFTQALNTAEAAEEANYVLGVLSQYSEYVVNCPIYYDIETVGNPEARLDRAYLSPAQHTENCIAFCSTIEAAGYQAGVYANMDWLKNKLIVSELETRYSIWLAHYSNETHYSGLYDVWQYSQEGFVNGIDTPVDRDVVYLTGNENRRSTGDPEYIVGPPYFLDGTVVDNPLQDIPPLTSLEGFSGYETMPDIPPLYETTTASDAVHYSYESMTLGSVGDSVLPILSGSGTITYFSSNPNAAQVDANGTITATGTGSADITALSSNGTSDTIHIQVANAPHLSIAGTSTILSAPGEMIVLENPKLDLSKVLTSNTDVVQVHNSGLIETTGYGSATITLYDFDGNPLTCHLVSPIEPPELGDCNLDGLVNAGDATDLLSYAAEAGSGTPHGLTFSHQMVFDFNADGAIDSSDASGILIQSACNGVGC